MATRASPETVAADPSQWCESSQRSVAVAWTKDYTSYSYNCWRCRAQAVFTAEAQKYTYEVKKAPIDQKRILCQGCWERMNAISAELAACENVWATSKPVLRGDQVFLQRWLNLIQEKEEYVPYKHDVARKNMLAKLLGDA